MQIMCVYVHIAKFMIKLQKCFLINIADQFPQREKFIIILILKNAQCKKKYIQFSS